MIRFLILAVDGYVAYRSLRSWMFPNASSSESVTDRNVGQIDDVMVIDTYCEAFFPNRNAVSLRFDGKDMLFCSTQCKDNFLAAQSKK